MADKIKSQKLASAKKKLKEFQSKHKPTSIDSASDAVFDGAAEPATTSSPPIHIDNSNDENLINLNNQDSNLVPSIVESKTNIDDLQNELIVPEVNQSKIPVVPSLPYHSNENSIELPQPSNAIDLQQQQQQIQTAPPVTDNSTALTHELHQATERNQELCSQMWIQHAAIEQMRTEIERLKAENSTKQSVEMDAKDKQLQAHIQSIEILIYEKTELGNQLSIQQTLVKSKTDEIDELQARLFASRYRGQMLEKELDSMRNAQEKRDNSQQQLCTELETLRDEMKLLKKSTEDSTDEIAELKQRLTVKCNEIERFEAELKRTTSDLNLSRLRIEQLSTGDEIESTAQLQTLLQERNQFEQQVTELRKTIETGAVERAQADQQYQSYVQHLSKESANLVGQIQSVAADNERLGKREMELTKHISDLERQIQQQLAKRKSLAEVNRSSESAEDVTKLTERCDELTAAKLQYEQTVANNTAQIQTLSIQLQGKIDECNQLQIAIEQMQSTQPNAKNLLEAIESDKVAASRAMTQNQDLKMQLEEIQKAYIQLSNDKLELTDRLQSEQHLGSEIRNRFSGLETELSELKQKLHYKDEEMIRLSHETVELNKEILQQHQELDRLRHYEAKSHSGALLHRELELANETIAKLRYRIRQFEQNNVKNTATSATSEETNATGDAKSTVADEESATADAEPEIGIDAVSETMSNSSTLNLATDQAMDRLQQRFTRTMAEVADLTEEKQRLEHLVMQLQGETETIGEYIALYQNQRKLLKQREIEKDLQLRHIASERESMRQSLVQLNNLVVQLLMQHGVENAKELVQSMQPTVEQLNQHNHDHHNHNHDDHRNETDHTKVDEPNMELIDSTKSQIVSTSNDLTKDHSASAASVPATIIGTQSAQTAETATEIIRILSEIKEKNLNPNLINFAPQIQHCHCCSGKLETV